MQLRWLDKSLNLVPMNHVGSGKNKREAKKKAMLKMIEDLVYHGYIAKGFKESDFVKKLPRRRKEESSDSESEDSIQILKAQGKLKQFLIDQEISAALSITTEDNVLLSLIMFSLRKFGTML